MLTDIQVRKAEARDKSYKLYDGKGLFVFISPSGHKSWRLKYKSEGKERLLVLGSYPAVTLKMARDMAGSAQQLRNQGLDPVLDLKRRKLVDKASQHSFEEMALRWLNLEKKHWRPVHADDVLKSIKRDLLPDLGIFPLSQIDRPLLLAVLQKVETRGAIETAHRLRQRCEAIFNLAITLGICSDNPAAGLAGALQRKNVKKRWPALTRLEEVRQLLRDTDTAGASPVTRAASRLLALTAQRPGVVRHMRWQNISGIDWEGEGPAPAATWTIPAQNMKLEAEQRADDSYDHEVPLAPAAVDLLRGLRHLTGSGEYVFWSSRSSRQPMSENALAYLYKRLGYGARHVPHGWRSSFSTIMNEIYADEVARTMSWRAIIDFMLAHVPPGMSATEWRYNRGKFADRRRAVANRWADLLLEGAVPLERTLTGPRREDLF